jgi:fumarate hydratase class II
MNCNEVIANRTSELLGGPIGKDSLVHPNDHVNKSQSSNDTFPTAMHVSAGMDLNHHLLPSLNKLKTIISSSVEKYKGLIKIGRTHTQDATPLTLGQEFSGYHQQISNHISHLEYSLKYIYQLAQGGTAVGTGLNTFEGFDVDIAKQIAEDTGCPFVTAPNKFESLATHDAMVILSGVLNSLATSLYKILNDLKLLSRDLNELRIVNKDYLEEGQMSCLQVIGNHTSASVGNLNGHFELNVFNPLIISNVLQSIDLLNNTSTRLCEIFLNLEVNYDVINDLMKRSLMLVTALNPYIGYSKSAEIAKYAHKHHLTLKEAALKLGVLTEEQFDSYVKPENMIAPSKLK